ncbi:MAG: hypothetical protein H6585_10445 [Flavobacteriales bacterium]|nr:hypothetical protein [Flavobacteriales bacterium]MCB9448751.1 hypothetical protein [Flavobacteriales bacterium]
MVLTGGSNLYAQDSLNIPPPDSVPAMDSTVTDSSAVVPADTTAIDPAPDPDSNRVMLFTKNHIEQSADSTIFDVLKITNREITTITGKLEIFAPLGWNVAYTAKDSYTIEPGATVYVPMRISIPGDAKGGMAHVINAAFKTKNAAYTADCYIKVIRKSRWSITTSSNVVYFNTYYNDVNFDVIISNKGNTPEVIYLEFEVGKNLVMPQFNANQRSRYIEVAPYKDTTLTFTVGSATKDEDTPSYLEQVWKESTVTVKASTAYSVMHESVWFKQVDNNYYNKKQQSATPLNMDVQFYNLMSTAQPRINSSIFGSVLFPQLREVNYMLNMRNVLFSPGKSSTKFSSDPQNLTAYVRYRDPKWNIIAGDNITSSGIFNANGRGISADYKINKDYSVYGSAFRNILYPIYTYAAGTNLTLMKKYRVNTGVSYEDNQYNHSNSIAYLIQSGTSFLKHHSVNGSLILGRTAYHKVATIPSSLDTNLYGLRWRLSYNYSTKKLRINSTATASTRFFARGGGNRNGHIGAMYMIDNHKRLNFLLDHYQQYSVRFPDVLYYQGSHFTHDMVRLTMSVNKSSRMYYEFGPNFRRTSSNLYYPAYNFTKVIRNTYLGAYGSARYTLSAFQTLTPSAIIGYSLIKQTDFDSVPSFNFNKPVLSTNLSLSYKVRHWMLSAYYVYGSLNVVDAQYLLQTGRVNQVFYLRPGYERYFMDKTVKVSGFMNYSIRMPSARENSSINLRLDVRNRSGWDFYGQGNAFINSWVDIEEGRQSFKTFNFSLGVRKAFDIPQPRLKYYDVKVVCFKDLNGNKIKDEGEPLIANILTDIKRVKYDKERGHGNFAQMELLTGPDGQISYTNLPEGTYRFSFTPLVNLGDLYNVNGNEQTVVVNSNTVLFIPFAASYKIKGKIVLTRDRFSSDGNIEVEGIRVTATNEIGEAFSVLTDKDGNYVLSVPQAGYYTISVNNIFGERFTIDKESYLIEFNGFDTFNVDFSFTEKKRDINVGGENNYQFRFLNEPVEEDDGGGE